jgi:hypothetical protein
MADELARSNEFPFEQRIAEAVSMGIPIEEIAQHFSDSKDKSHKLWLQQYKGLQVAERARERTGQTSEPSPTAEQSTLAKAQKWAEENPITTAALATGAAGLAAGGAYAIKERIKSNAEIRKERELAKIIPPGVQQQREELDFRKQQFAAEQEKLIRAETDNAIKTTKQGQLAAGFEQKFNIPFAQAEQFSGGKITNPQDAEIIGNAIRNKLSAAVNPIPGAVSNQPAGVPNAVSPMSQLRQPPAAPAAPAAPAGAAAPAVPMQAAQPPDFVGPSPELVGPSSAPPPANSAPPESSITKRTRRNAEQIAADREALLASAPEGRLPSAPNPKKSNKLMPGDVIGQGGWHWYKGQMGPEAEENWLRAFGRTNVSEPEVRQAMKEGRLPSAVVKNGKGGEFTREATVPNYIKGRASLGSILSTAAGAGLMATAGSKEGQEAMKRAASAIRDLGVSPDMLMSKGEELGRLGNAYVNAGNQNYRAELQQQIAVEQDPKRLNQLIRELQKTGTVGGGRGVAPPSAYR